MHELSVLYTIMKTVNGIAEKNQIKLVKFITLEVGTESSYVPVFLKKLFPVAVDQFSILQQATLNIIPVPGSGLVIKEIGY